MPLDLFLNIVYTQIKNNSVEKRYKKYQKYQQNIFEMRSKHYFDIVEILSSCYKAIIKTKNLCDWKEKKVDLELSLRKLKTYFKQISEKIRSTQKKV